MSTGLIEGRSLWADTLPGSERFTSRPLDGDIAVDVAIVGAGLTGLWTAHHLLERDRSLRVALFDRQHVGFGASGRNGGWCSSLLPMSLATIADRHGEAAATRMQQAMHDTVASVVRFAADRGIEDVCHQGGTITLARTRPQLERIRHRRAELARFGFGDEILELDTAEASRRCAATNVLGAIYTPHTATVHPARLTHAVANAVTAAGAEIYEHTTVESIEPGRLGTDRGTVTAGVIVRATEGYTVQLPGERRTLLPIYSMMVATEPLPDEAWAAIGLDDRPTFHDARNLIIYGQRTTDGRIAFGGRGAPYHFGSAVRPDFDTDDRVRRLLTAALRELFPVLDGVEITHHWGGVLAAPRDWHCSVRFDRASGLASAGGYVGDGVSTTHLAGATLAALITESVDDADRELTQLPWVGHHSRKWEPEPLRWIGVNAARTAAAKADAVEHRGDRPSRFWGGIVKLLLGH